MDYEPYDSSGTDDDLPPAHQNRIPRGGHIAANGRSAVVSVPYPSMYGQTKMEAHIHQLEQEAYISVLRAFKAQADAITWEKESLIMELRKDLRLSNEEHRELLGQVDADDVIRRIREWRKGGRLQPGMACSSQAVNDLIPSATVSASRKKQKITAAHQLSTSAAKRESVPGAKGNKKHKPSLPYPSSGAPRRAQLANRVSSGAIINEATVGPTFDKLIGRRLRTRWPDDNNFYEAVITAYNAIEGQHALVYDIGTPNEMLEWVNLSEISSDDIQWEGNDPGVSQRGTYGQSGHAINRPAGHDSTPVAGRGRGVPKSSRKAYLPSQSSTGNKAPDDIQILHTDTLIKEVERVFGANHPDPREIEKAKKVLKDHEQTLIDAIARLADICYGESDKEGHHFSHRQSMERV